MNETPASPLPRSYYIRGGDGNEYGPADLTTMARWLRDDQARADTLVREADATEWRPLGEFPELAALAPPRPVPPAEPPPGSLPTEEEILARENRFSVGAMLVEGYRRVLRQPGPLIGSAAVVLGIFIAIGLIGVIPFAAALTTPASIILSGPLMGGLWLVFIRAGRGHTVEVREVFGGFGPSFVDLLLVNLILTVAMVIGLIPGLVPVAIGAGLSFQAGQVEPPAALFLGCGIALCALGSLVAWTFGAYATALVIDRRMAFWPALRLGARVMARRWFRNLVLLVLASILGMLGYLLCFVGIFLTFPWIFGVYAAAYEEQFGPRPAAPATP